MNCEDHVPEWALAILESAQVEQDPAKEGYILNVSGHAPRDGQCCERPRLHPREEYLVQPEYWETMVEWDKAGALFQSIVPFNLSMPLTGFVGTKGVEVIGKNKSFKIEVP